MLHSLMCSRASNGVATVAPSPLRRQIATRSSASLSHADSIWKFATSYAPHLSNADQGNIVQTQVGDRSRDGATRPHVLTHAGLTRWTRASTISSIVIIAVLTPTLHGAD